MAKGDCGPCSGTGLIWESADGDTGKNPWKSRQPVTCPHCNGSGKK